MFAASITVTTTTGSGKASIAAFIEPAGLAYGPAARTRGSDADQEELG